MSTPSWLVLIADVRASRRIPSGTRATVDRAIRVAMARTAKKYAGVVRLGPELLRGDELQAVLRPDAPALAMLTYLRAQVITETAGRVALRAGLGLGAIERLSPKGPFESDGEAFHRARVGIEAAKKAGGSTMTAWRTGDPFLDRVTDAMLGMVDAFVSRWTVPQWEAIAGRLESRALESIAKQKGVGFRSVSKRLRAASWNEVQRAIELIDSLTAIEATTGRPDAVGSGTGSPSKGRTRSLAPRR